MNIRLRNKKNIDIKSTKKQPKDVVLRRREAVSVLFSRGKRSDKFFTEDSKLYITPLEQKMLRNGINLDRNVKKWDSLSSHIVSNFVRVQPSKAGKLLELWKEHSEMIKERSEMFSD